MGILKTNNMTFDDSGIFMSLEKAKKFLSLNGVTQFSINLEDFSRVDELKKDVKSKFQNLELYDWRELYPALIQSREMMVIFNYISYLIVFIIASIGVFGVMLVSIMERLREFAILRAIGTKFSYIFYMIFFESLLMGLSGFIVGSVLGGGTLYYFSIYGLDLTQFSDALSEFGMDAITFATIKVEYFITAFISVFSATLLSLVGPLRFLRKRTPIEVING
jgi:ABC-type lipoprotein release transport system permease subunit